MKLINKIKKILGVRKSHLSYWKQRAKNMGERSVINLKYKIPLNEITDYQERKIFPYLVSNLKGNEKLLLDFGCGSGRFTNRLALVTGAKSIGLDPTDSLIKIARENDSKNKYIISKNNKIPLPDATIDIVWICLVMGGIAENKMNLVVYEIERVLKNGALLMLIENTSAISNSEYWSYRTPEAYLTLFKTIDLTIVGSYKEVDEEITIMLGRKKEITV